MTTQRRSTFLQIVGAISTLPLALRPPRVGASATGHDFLSRATPDSDADRMWHGYPDECYSYTTFADSLVALAWGHGWYMQPPMVDMRNAIIVDFASRTEIDAEASIAGGWNGAWEFPMGTLNTIADRVEVNEQNARLSRHLSLIATGMRQCEFHGWIVEPLLCPRSCKSKGCNLCAERPSRHLADVFKILAEGTGQIAVQLFSHWEPCPNVRAAEAGVAIVHHPLVEIPASDLEANRRYHIWDGTPLQAEEFRKTLWAPAWRRAHATAK